MKSRAVQKTKKESPKTKTVKSAKKPAKESVRTPARTAVAKKVTSSRKMTTGKNLSTKIVPTIQPATAKRAARSLFAEKNFWYMFASPSNKNIVGRNKANAACGPRAPKSDT